MAQEHLELNFTDKGIMNIVYREINILWYYNRIYKYFNTANYLTAVQMYLSDNVLLREPLQKKHVKSIPSGHWGASPGINMIISCIINALQISGDTEIDYNLILGTGHANAALLSNMYLNGYLSDYFPQFEYGYEGIKALCQAYGSPNGFSGEISAKMPGCIYPGGELGYALGIAYGTVLGKRNQTTFVIIGDGECETSVTCASWFSPKLIADTVHGNVIPIINLNQYKMGSDTLLSRMSDNEIIGYFSGVGLKAIICNDWRNLADSLLDTIKTKHSNNNVFLFRTVKGWTGPYNLSLSECENALKSHKIPLRDPSKDDYEFEALKKWLLSYSPSNLFDSNGKPDEDVLQMKCKQLFQFPAEIETPSASSAFTIKTSKTMSASFENVLIKQIEATNDLFIFSPDELSSNGFRLLLEKDNLKNHVIEVLNENLCQVFYEGLTLTNRHGVLVSYECFIPIVTSAVSQYAKFLYHSLASQSIMKTNRPSLVYLLTSICWNNTYSHQNPEFVMDLISKGYSFIHALYPIDKNTGVVMLQEALQSENDIRIITYDKRSQADIMSFDTARDCVRDKYYIWPTNNYNTCDCMLISTGDIQAAECNKVICYFEEHSDLSIKHISILDLSLLSDEGGTVFRYLLNKCLEGRPAPIIYVFEGYPSLIESLLYHNNHSSQIQVFGYNNRGWDSVPSLMKQIDNGISHWNIGIKICESLLSSDSTKKGELMQYKEQFKAKMNEYYASLYVNSAKKLV